MWWQRKIIKTQYIYLLLLNLYVKLFVFQGFRVFNLHPVRINIFYLFLLIFNHLKHYEYDFLFHLHRTQLSINSIHLQDHQIALQQNNGTTTWRRRVYLRPRSMDRTKRFHLYRNLGKFKTRTQPSADPTTNAEHELLKFREKTGFGVETTPKHCFVFASNTFASLFWLPPARMYFESGFEYSAVKAMHSLLERCPLGLHGIVSFSLPVAKSHTWSVSVVRYDAVKISVLSWFRSIESPQI